MPRSLAEFLQHVLDETAYLSKTAQTTTKKSFLTDETLRRSFVRSIEIIGEAIRFPTRPDKDIRISSGGV
jgi:uncharacterized protein with HEPN domain